MGLQFPLSFGRHHNSKTWHSSDTQVLVWPATAGLVLVAGLPLWLSTGMVPSSAETESTSSTAWSRGKLTLRLMLTTDMVEPTPDTALAVLAMVVLATVMARGLLRLTPTTAVPTLDTAMAVLATAMAVLATVMARGPLTLRLMPTTAMAVMVGTDLDTPLATAMVDTDTSDKSAKGCCRELQPMKYAASQN